MEPNHQIEQYRARREMRKKLYGIDDNQLDYLIQVAGSTPHGDVDTLLILVFADETMDKLGLMVSGRGMAGNGR